MYEALKYIAKGCWCVTMVLLVYCEITDAEGALLGWLVTALGVSILLEAAINKLRREANKSKPVTTVNARIFSHRTESWGRSYANKRYFVKFLVGEEKTRLELEVSMLEFEGLHPGDEGVLRYRDWEYLSFVPGQQVAEIQLPPVNTQDIQMAESAPDNGILTHELEE